MANELIIEIQIDEKKLEKDLQKALIDPFKRAFTRSTEHLFSVAAEEAPGTLLRTGMHFETDFKPGLNAVGFIGFPEGSEVEKIAAYTDMGTGQRGSNSFQSYFGESKPLFTIPILPLKSKALHWFTPEGEEVFARSSKGQKSNPWFRKSIKDHLVDIQKIWASEFK